mgnify:CR=1 FL=1
MFRRLKSIYNIRNGKSKFNVFLIYVFFAYMILDQKIFTLILNSNKNISISVISTLEILLQVITIVLEIPTGILGDNYSKKNILIISRVTMIIYSAIMLLSTNRIILAVAFASLGIGEALVSGMEESFISDITNSDDELLNKYMFFSTTNQIATVIAVFVGGILINYNWKAIYIVMIATQILSIYVLNKIEYEPVKKTHKHKLKEYVKQLLKIRTENLQWLKIGFWGSIFAAIYSVYTIYLPLFLSFKGISSFYISIISCIQISLGFFLMTALGKFAEQKFTKRICLIAIILFLFGLPFLLSDNIILLSIGSIVSSSFGITFFPAITTLINEGLRDEIRATGNSLVNLLQTIFMCVAFTIIGILI